MYCCCGGKGTVPLVWWVWPGAETEPSGLTLFAWRKPLLEACDFGLSSTLRPERLWCRIGLFMGARPVICFDSESFLLSSYCLRPSNTVFLLMTPRSSGIVDPLKMSIETTSSRWNGLVQRSGIRYFTSFLIVVLFGILANACVRDYSCNSSNLL